MYADWEDAERIRRRFPAGMRIVLDRMGEDPRPVPAGTKGTVLYVGDIGTVHCRFDDGRRLGLVPGEDLFHTIRPRGRDAR